VQIARGAGAAGDQTGNEKSIEHRLVFRYGAGSGTVGWNCTE